VVCVGSGLARPAARDFALRCLESGFALARDTDVRNLAHAELASFDPQRDWLVFAAAGDEQKTYLRRFLEVLPADVRAIRLEAPRNDVRGALSLLAASALSFDQIGVEGSSGRDWAVRLSRLAVPRPE